MKVKEWRLIRRYELVGVISRLDGEGDMTCKITGLHEQKTC